MAYYESDGTLFFADTFNNRVRFVDAGGKIHTLLGGDSGYEFGAKFNMPADVAIIDNTIFVADTGNSIVMKMQNFDRTGDNFESALVMRNVDMDIIGDARTEHTDVLDADFFDFRDFTEASRIGLHISPEAADHVNLGFFDSNTELITAVSLDEGKSYFIDVDEFSFLSVHGLDAEYLTTYLL